MLENIVLFTIPEPATISLLCLGTLALLKKRRIPPRRFPD
ncbi:MAG: PEP-CTERM sorting domain-containing protein [Planctomycetota bacterium]